MVFTTYDVVEFALLFLVPFTTIVFFDTSSGWLTLDVLVSLHSRTLTSISIPSFSWPIEMILYKFHYDSGVVPKI